MAGSLHHGCIDHKANWNRDLRASGITEGDEADADVRDQATQAGITR